MNTRRAALCCSFMLASACLAGNDFSIPWYTIDSGGALRSSGGKWELSGTVGQWDASEAHRLSGGDWRLSSGFWSVTLEEPPDVMFADGFEGP